MKRRLFLASLALLGALVATPLVPRAVSAATDPFDVPLQNQCTPKGGSFLGFPTWYKYLKGQNNPSNKDSKANVCRPTLRSPNDIWLVVAALFEIVLRLAGIAAVIYVIYGGFRYITSQGSPDSLNAAKTSIANAVIGLVMTIFAARLVGFIAGRFTGSTNNDFLLPNVAASAGTLGTVLNLAFQIAGALAVVFIVIGGINYSRSNGDAGSIKRAKETIIYAVVGLVIALFATAIINFVLERA